MHQMGNGDDDFDAEFAAPQHPGNFAVLILRSAIDFIREEYRAAVLQTPDRPRVGQCALAFGHVNGIDLLRPLGLSNLFTRAQASAPRPLFLLPRFLTSRLLALFFRTHRIRFGGLHSGRAAEFLFQLFNTLHRPL